MSLGENIRKRRIALHMSQQEIADAMGYKTRSSIAKIEKGNARLNQTQIVTMANILHTTTEYLLTGNQPAKENHHGTIIEDEIRVKEKPVIIYTMEVFQRHPMVDDIYVVCLDGWEDFIAAYAAENGIAKLKGIIPAGETGIMSVRNSVEWLSSTCSPYDILLIHEATRPLVDPEEITNVILCCKQYGSGVTFERMDRLTPFLENENGNGLTHLPATRLINVQSPEAYTLGSLRQAFHEAAAINHQFHETICAVFLHHMGRDLKFCEGNHNNLRVVTEDDLRLLGILV